jgi:hypothetical protein
MLRSASCVLWLVMAATGCASKPSEYKYSEAKSSTTSHCLKSGTRIQTRDGNCSQPGSSSRDLSRSHVTTAAGALRGVSPAITIRQ